MFASDAPLRQVVHLPGCKFGDGFYKIVYDDEFGRPHTRVYTTQADADLLVKILPPGRNIRAYRDACLDAAAPVDAATPDVVDGDWWLGLPKAQAMEELGLTKESEYARVHRMVEDMVYARDNRRTQGGVKAPVVIRRRRAPHLAHLFPQSGGLTDASTIGPDEYEPVRGS
jgi:hypothetical protein